MINMNKGKSESKDNGKYKIQLREQVLGFCDDLQNTFPEENDLIALRILLDITPIDKISEGCIKFLLPHSDKIKKKNEKFFLEGNDIFSKLDPNKVNYFKKIWNSSSVTQEEKDTIWQWFELLLVLTEKIDKK